MNDWPRIRVFIDNVRREEIFFGIHPKIPYIGEHICVENKCHEICRVEHILSSTLHRVHADVYIDATPT